VVFALIPVSLFNLIVILTKLPVVGKFIIIMLVFTFVL